MIARLTDQNEREITKLRSLHASDKERLRDELHSQHNQEIERVNDTHEQQVKQLEVSDKHNVVVWLERVTTATLNFVSNLFMYCIFMLFIICTAVY